MNNLIQSQFDVLLVVGIVHQNAKDYYLAKHINVKKHVMKENVHLVLKKVYKNACAVFKKLSGVAVKNFGSVKM